MIDISHVWSEWEIEKKVGEGAHGEVYQAVRRDDTMVSRAAIKVITIPQDEAELDSLRADGLDKKAIQDYFGDIVDNFINEIRIMNSLRGTQNIVSIEDYKVVEREDHIGCTIYIRMELLTDFFSHIQDKNMSQEEVIKLGHDICNALDVCAKQNIIHRDIKPENIFVNYFGDFKLGDFGTARRMENLFGGMSQKGTFNYMAPEVFNGRDYDARVDVYSLGLVLYRLLNNNMLPFMTEKDMLSPKKRQTALERRMRGEKLTPPCNASKDMASVILKACAYKPEDRFRNAAEMREALEQVRVEETQAEEEDSKGNTGVAIFIGIIIGCLAILGIVFVMAVHAVNKYKSSEDGPKDVSHTVEATEQADIVQTEESTAQEEVFVPEVDFQFENVEAHVTSINDGASKGMNKYGETVWYCVSIGFDLPEEIRRKLGKTQPSVECTWGEIINGTKPDYSYTIDYDAVLKGETCAEVSRVHHAEGFEEERFVCWIALPDDPDIAGEQTITVHTGGKELKVHFTLFYKGDYINGIGWDVWNIHYE